MSENKRSPTMREVARELGFGLATVSLALRDSPKVSKLTRERVCEVARRMGYRPNPLLAVYQQHVRSQKSPQNQATIGWINDYPEGDYWRDHPLKNGALARCEELGYKLDEIHINGMEHPDEPEYNVRRFIRVLNARGIHGVLLPNLHRGNMTTEDWNPVSVVLIGNYDGTLQISVQARERHVRYHQVAADVALNVWNALEILRSKGFVRIGLAITAYWNAFTDSAAFARYLAYQASWPVKERLPAWVLRGGMALSAADSEQAFGEWFGKNRPDAILCCNREVRQWVKNLGAGERVKLVHLSVSEEGADWCGIDERMDRQGEAAVDLLSAHMLRNQRGLPVFPKKVLVPGEWRNGMNAGAGRSSHHGARPATQRSHAS